MTIGSWDPEAQAAADTTTIDANTVQRFIAYSREEQLEHLTGLIEGDQCQRLASYMGMEHSLWRATADSLDDDALLHLIRFFAVAENLPGWEAGDSSPVIPLAKALRKRGRKLDKDFLAWLKSVNSNRFLPYGPL